MKRILIKEAGIIDPNSPYNGQRKDILIENGIIKSIGDGLKSNDAEIVDFANQSVSPGWFDMRANFWDPGKEYKEDIESGSEAAASGGFTGVCLVPETEPAITAKSHVEYIKQKSGGKVTDVHIAASISTEKDGTTLTEMYDLVNAGAIAFSSGYRAVHDAGFLLRALVYTSNLKARLVLFPQNGSLSIRGVMNEGDINVLLGMKGIPAVAEEVEIQKIISLCRYTNTPVHITCVSSQKSIALIDAAKKEGLPVTADVCIHNLYFTDKDLLNFDTNLKLRPPLRAEEDQKALRKAFMDGIIDSVVSDHTPHEFDSKVCEFENAAYGAIGLQTIFSQLIMSLEGTSGTPAKGKGTRETSARPKSHSDGLAPVDRIIEALALKPRQILGLGIHSIKENEKANLTVFDTEKTWTLDEKTNKSKSKNSPLWGKELRGKALAVVNGENLSQSK